MQARLVLTLLVLSGAAHAIPLGAPSVASQDLVRETGEVTVNGSPVTVVRYTWKDSAGLARSVSLVPASGATSGYAAQMSYFDAGLGRHVYLDADPGADGGFGYFVSHELFRDFTGGGSGTIAGLHGEDDSPLGRYLPSTGSAYSVGARQAVHEYRLTYPRWGTVAAMPDPSSGTVSPASADHQKFNLPVTIRWTFTAGTDYPLWSVDYDLTQANDHIATDVRAPYGAISFTEGAQPAVTVLKWGDLFHFAASADPNDISQAALVAPAVPWTWNAVNNGRRYNVLGSGAYELGLVDTIPRASSKYADGYANWRGLASPNGASCDYGLVSLPCDWEWAYQSFQFDYGPPARPKIAWGSSPYLGSSLTTVYVNDSTPESLAGKGHISYALHVVFGRAGAGAPLTTGRAAVPLENNRVLSVQSVPAQAGGSVTFTILGDPGGPYSASEAVLAPWASVALTATPANGYVFESWDSCEPAQNCACAGSTDSTCRLTLGYSSAARARFVLPNTRLVATPRLLNFGDRPLGATAPVKSLNLVYPADTVSLALQSSDPRVTVTNGACGANPAIQGCAFDLHFSPPAAIGGTAPSTPLASTVTISSGTSASLVLDVRGNAVWKNELPWRNTSSGQVWHMRMNGFSIASSHAAYTEPDTAWRVVSDGDFNGDGLTDLLWRNFTNGQVYVMPLDAAGNPAGGAIATAEPDAAWKIVATPDLDGDGKADIVWWNSTTGQVYAMLMSGALIREGGFVYTEPDTNWRIVAAGDFVRSGRANQLLWRHRVNGQVYVLAIGGVGGITLDSAWGKLIYAEPNAAWKILSVADFNGDGTSDILWRNDQTGQVYMMLMGGAPGNPTIIGQGLVYTEPNTQWKIVSQRDYNGDGKADLLWRNDTTGQVYLMLMNGLSISSAAMIYQEPNTAWKILGSWEYANTNGLTP